MGSLIRRGAGLGQIQADRDETQRSVFESAASPDQLLRFRQRLWGDEMRSLGGFQRLSFVGHRVLSLQFGDHELNLGLQVR